MKYALDNWSSTPPDHENVGQWLYCKVDPNMGLKHMRMFPVEVCLREGEIWLADIAHPLGSDMMISALGNSLGMWGEAIRLGQVSFCGPIPMPPGYRKKYDDPEWAADHRRELDARFPKTQRP